MNQAERGPHLQLHAGAVGLDRRDHGLVVHVWQPDAGEQVAQNALKEGHVLIEELGQVDVADGAQHEDVLRLVGQLALEVAGGAQHRNDCAHACMHALPQTMLKR